MRHQVHSHDLSDRRQRAVHQLALAKAVRIDRTFQPQPVQKPVAGDGQTAVHLGIVARAGQCSDQRLKFIAVGEVIGLVDLRHFGIGAQILFDLGVRQIRLLTNNPAKIAQLSAYGIEVAGRVPHIFEANAHNRGYLLTKARRSGILTSAEEEALRSGEGEAAEEAKRAAETEGQRTELVASSVRYGKLPAPIGTPEVNVQALEAGRK